MVLHENDRRLKLIQGCYLFAGVEVDLLSRIAEVSSEQTCRKSTSLFSQGDEANGLYIVIDGLVRIWVNNEDGKELTLTILEPGDAFGEIALLDGLPRTASATAIDASSLLYLPRDSFLKIVESTPRLSMHLIQLLCERLRRNTDDISNFAFLDLPVRLARKLIDLAVMHGDLDGNAVTFNRRYSQTDLAQMLGVTREAINKQMAAWVKSDLLEMVSGRIKILDYKRIRNFSKRD
ncbi:MAG: Crp/Fnr family transcriptional regulator [Stappiaceae bacterium]